MHKILGEKGVSWRKVCWGEKCVGEKGVSGRKVCQGEKCVGEKGVWGEKCVGRNSTERKPASLVRCFKANHVVKKQGEGTSSILRLAR